MESLKLLFVAFEFPPYPLAGTGMYALNLLNNLNKHEITLITADHKGSIKEEINSNIKIIKLDTSSSSESSVNRSFIDKKSLFSMKARKYLKNINLKDYNVLHSLTLRDGAFLDYRYLNNHLKTVISVNDYYIIGSSFNPFNFEFTTDFPVRYFHHNIMKNFYFKALRDCDKIIPNTNFVKDIILKDSNIPPSKIAVVNRGINTSRFESDPPKNKYFSHNVLFVGPNAERKGAIYVLKSAPEIVKKFPDSTFTIIGNSSWIYKKKMNNFLRKHDLSCRVNFIDHIPQDELVGYYKKANVFVMPSVMEAFGQVYLEAMTAKTPVIGADVGGVSDIITPEIGYLVPPKNHDAISKSIIDLFNDSDRARVLGENGNNLVKEKFSIGRMVKETEDVYKSLV